jgi:DNA-binding CsgD family transcriptional regulator
LVSRVYSLAEDSLLYSRLPFQSRRDSVEPIRIVEGTKILKFVVESFKFKDVNIGRFRYFLKGLNDGYGDWTNTTVKEYTNLEVGDYEFLVQTYDYLGEIITSRPVRIEVIPPLYKTLVAKVIYTVFVLLILFLLYRFQKQHYRDKQTRMEQAKQEELALKQQEVQELKEEKIKSELRHVNNLLAASTMNLVVKNEFMENIKEEIKQVKQNGRVEDTEKALERIIKEIDSTLKLQEDWQQFEYHFDKVHGDFLTRLTNEFSDLTPGEQKLCAFLRLKMDTKEIANLMGVSLRGVEVARYRLRKKLGLDKHQNLSKFVLEY